MSTTDRAPSAIKERLREAALAEFNEHGYQAATLEAIARRLGVTRAAVLYHVHSKAALLDLVVQPALAALGAALERTPASMPPTARERAQLIEAIYDVFDRHREVLRLLRRDLSTLAHHDIVIAAMARIERFADLLAGDGDEIDRSLARAAVAAIAGPISAIDAPIDRPGVREALIGAARSIVQRIGRHRSVPA